MGNDRIAIVTGASRGLGRVTAERLAGSGYVVAAVATSTASMLDLAEHPQVSTYACDVADASQIDDVFARISADLGVATLLINNAGLGGPAGLTWEAEPGEWWRTFEVNVRGPYLTSRALLPGMLERGSGRIVNVSSGAAYFPVAGGTTHGMSSAYMASKAAVLRLTEALAGETVGTGVTAFAVSPGTVKTDMTASLFADDWDDPELWSEPTLMADLIEFIDTGAVDALSGRFIHAAWHEWRDLPARIDEIIAADSHVARMI